MLSVVTYALCKKLISESATGIKSIEVDEHGDLVFILGDDTRITVDLPFKANALDIQFPVPNKTKMELKILTYPIILETFHHLLHIFLQIILLLFLVLIVLVLYYHLF